MPTLLLGALLLSMVAGCPSVQSRVAIKDCQFNLRDVRILKITPFEAKLAVKIGVYNPNDIEVIVDRFDYVVLVNGRRLADGANTHDLLIPVNGSGDVNLTVRANVVDAAVVIGRLRKGGKRVATVRGTYYVRVPWGRYPFPVEVSRSF